MRHLHVNLLQRSSCESLIALITLERQLAGAFGNVSQEVAVYVESSSAGFANKWLLARVYAAVRCKRSAGHERLVAHLALELARAVMHSDMVRVMGSPLEVPIALIAMQRFCVSVARFARLRATLTFVAFRVTLLHVTL